MNLRNEFFVHTPKKLVSNTDIGCFLYKSQCLFEYENKRENGFVLDLSKTQEYSSLGIFLIAKFIDHSVHKECFNSPQIKAGNSGILGREFAKYGLKEVTSDCFSVEFKRKHFNVNNPSENMIIAPQIISTDGINKNIIISVENINTKYFPIIQKYYPDTNTATMIISCFSELILNFTRHAENDNRLMTCVCGDDKYVEIICIDCGKGIISSMSDTLDKKLNKKKILELALKKGISSKKDTNHMGYGLWLLDEIAKRTNGRFYIYSEGASYCLMNKNTKYWDCGDWKGTIIYLYLPLNNPVTPKDIISVDLNNTIKLNVKK